ncbi:hypothetical protein JOE63_000670 [Cellulosimicrobium cellulans]|jgi:hypothetical protein|uniref:Small multidrug efflux protein n=1 Tax=Cellulosimicrobium cellulans TaxID=1710 RepID=A0A1Y0HU86_CELCE|nr:hypothetical protein [Cellulosimicrobium cellulans]ARU51711.1 hypothetical protein CBR64_09665 [Cellulosimicrobium cellulans]MBM7818193.1 hypothetical protein [Cellulosimicrobium cellulans]
MTDIVTGLQELTQGLPPLLRWVGVLLAGAIPYVEAEGAAILGVVAGVNPVVAIVAAVVGNAIALALVVWLIGAARSGVTRGRAAAQSPKQQRMRKVFDRYGVPGVSLLGPLLLPSHVTAAAMVGFGAPRARVFTWGVVAVTAWAVVLGILVHLGVSAAVA